MAKNLGGAIIDLLDSERVDLRAAAATVLAAVGKSDKSVQTALTGRLADRRRAACAGSRSKASPTWAPAASRPSSCRCSAATTRCSPSAPRRCSRSKAPRPRARCARKSRAGPVGARRVMAQLLLRRGTQPAIDAVLDQLSDNEFGEQALQLVRAELDSGNEKLANQVEKSAVVARERGRQGARTRSGRRRRRPPPTRRRPRRRRRRSPKKKAERRERHATATPRRRRSAARSRGRARHRRARRAAPPDRLPRAAVDAVAAAQVRRSRRAAADPARRDRRPAPHRRAERGEGTEKVIETLIEYADGEDSRSRSPRSTRCAARASPSRSRRRSPALAKSKNVMAQKLAMERLPAGGGAPRSRRSSRRSAATIRRRATRPPAASRRRPSRCCP